jgi:hypothetical protein
MTANADAFPVLPSTDYRGILDLEPREPISAALTAGRKVDGGGVSERDRFHLTLPSEDEKGARPLHPAFASFNDGAPEKRRVVYGVLIHAYEEECWWWQNAAFRLPGWPSAPSRRNGCVGGLKGGEMKARRYFGQMKEAGPNGQEVEVEDWREIVCPNRLCEFQQGDAPPCRPGGRLYFQLRWPQTKAPMPCVETMYETHGANTVAYLAGFFAQLHQQAAHLGIERYSLYGLPFVLTMAQRRQPAKRRKWWEVRMTADCVLQDFFLRQRREVAELGGELPERRLLTTVASRPPRPEAGPVHKPAAVLEADADEAVDGEILEGDSAPPAPEPAPDSAARWAALQAKARGLALTDADLEAAVARVSGGGIFPDLEPDQDAAVEAELQAAARKRGKR